jgi:shikimate dehydrogenase
MKPKKLAGLIGFPLSHSVSPQMHKAAFEYYRMDADYVLWETAPDQVATRVGSLRQEQYYGANVTVPHKRLAMDYLDEIVLEAAKIGAVNTIVNRSGVLSGYNTDAEGFLRSLELDGHLDPRGGRVIILGAGGAARAVTYALASRKPASILVVNRDQEKAVAVCRLARTEGTSCRSTGYDELYAGSNLEECDLLINATSVGLRPGESPLDLRRLPTAALVYDLIYRPTLLLQSAKEAGARTLSGLSMLVYQGALSFTLWTGLEAPVPVMRAAAEQALGAGDENG